VQIRKNFNNFFFLQFTPSNAQSWIGTLLSKFLTMMRIFSTQQYLLDRYGTERFTLVSKYLHKKKKISFGIFVPPLKLPQELPLLNPHHIPCLYTHS